MKLFWRLFGPWIERRREKRAAKQYGRMLVLLTLSPGALEQLKNQLAEDDWTERRENR